MHLYRGDSLKPIQAERSMISAKSIRIFFVFNGIIGSVGLLQWVSMLYLSMPFHTLFIFLRNLAVSYGIEFASAIAGASLLNRDYTPPIEHFPGEFIAYVGQAAAIESVFTSLNMSLFSFSPSNVQLQLLTFIPVSFLFEVIYDFFHYWSHRLMHTYYVDLHKSHHRHIHLRPILAFYQNGADLIFTNALPFLATEYIFSVFYSLSAFELALILSYKVFIEIAGHTGRASRATSFPQCIWLPRALGIELSVEDHNVHHTHTGTNFSKRFTLWDRVFGTYRRDT